MFMNERKRNKMYSEERRNIIKSLIKSQKQVKVTDLADRFGISSVTVRKDLSKMEKEGLLKRTFGGAIEVTLSKNEKSYNIKKTEYIAQKRNIANKAVKFIANDMTIFLDAGTSVRELIPFLQKFENIFIVTIDLNIALHLLDEGMKNVYFIGGKLSPKTYSSNSTNTVIELKNFNFDLAFVGCDAFTTDYFQVVSEVKAQLKINAIKDASLSIILADSSKFEKSGLINFASMSDIDYLITDKDLQRKLEQNSDTKILGSKKNYYCLTNTIRRYNYEQRIYCNYYGRSGRIGPEEVVKSLNKPEVHEKAKVVVVGDKKILEDIKRIVKSNIEIHVIHDLSEGEYRAGVIDLIDLDNIDMSTFEYGKVQKQCGQAAYEYIEKANDLCVNHGVSAMVTTTLNKESLQVAGITTLGHTDILAKLTGVKDPLTMFQVQNLRVFFYSKHVPLRKACDLITKEGIEKYVHLMVDALHTMGIENPHVAVAGLNPHCGDGGLFGNEEIEYIIPAIKDLQDAGVNVSGPISADSVFYQANMGKYDGVLSLYHDQGHIATKTLDPDLTVSFTHNLPYLRTSVDHGTAFDIAGKGIAREKSLDEAIRLASKYAGSFRRAKKN